MTKKNCVAEIKSKMVFDPPFRPFALVYKIPQEVDGIPQIDIELRCIEIKTTGELYGLVRQHDLSKMEPETDAEAEEFNENFERLNKEGGFREFVRPWQEQLLFHIMEQQGLLKPADSGDTAIFCIGSDNTRYEDVRRRHTDDADIEEGTFDGKHWVEISRNEYKKEEEEDRDISPDSLPKLPSFNLLGNDMCGSSCEIAAETTRGAYMEDQLREHAAYGGVDRIAGERLRQITEEGFDATHDDKHENGELVDAAICYATNGRGCIMSWIPPTRSTVRVHLRGQGAVGGTCAHGVPKAGLASPVWPWAEEQDKREKHDCIRSLEIAGALICAEIDRLLRLEPTVEEESE